MMTSSPDDTDRHAALQAADRDLELCILLLPLAAAATAFLIGFRGALNPQNPWAGAPLWYGLGGCGLFLAWAWLSERGARRGYVRIEMPAHEIRRRLTGMRIGAAFLMVAIGVVALGALRSTWDPARHQASLFVPVEHPRPLVGALVALVLAGVLLLGKSLWDRWGGGSADDAESPAWTRFHSRYLAARRGEGMLLVVIGLFLLALVVGVLRTGLAEPIRWAAAAFFAVLSWLGVLSMRRSRRYFEAAGLTPEEVREEIASTWRIGAVIMTLVGGGGLGLVFLGADHLEPMDLRWAVGSALAYTLTGALLFWRNWSRRGL